MKRWIAFAAGAAMAAMGTLGVHAAEVEGPKLNWSISLWGAKRAASMGIEEVAKLVEEKTGGNFKIRLAYGEALSASRENLDGIKLGAFEGANFCNFYHPGKNPTAMVLALPFLPIPHLDVLQHVAEKVYAHPSMQSDMDRWNAMIYMSTLLPTYEAMGRGKAPETLEDWKGMRVRAGGGMGDAMELLGATKSTVPAPEVYTMLDRGSVDAATFPYTYAFASYKLHEVSSWFTTNLALGIADCPVVFNKDAYAKLPEQYKKLLWDVKPAGYAALKRTYQEIDAKNLPMFKGKMQAVEYSEDELNRFRTIGGRPVWDAWVKEWQDKIPAQEVLDLVLNEARIAIELKNQGKL